MGKTIHENDQRNPIQADGRIIMIYGTIFEEDRFDATKWFKDGMYRLRHQGGPWMAEDTMYRAYVPPVPDSRLSNLRASLSVLLDPKADLWRSRDGLDPLDPDPLPASYKQLLRDPKFDPRPLMIYEYSEFGKTQNPCDIYTVYLLIEGQRVFVDIALDAITGETEFGKTTRRTKFTDLPVSDARTDWLFKRLEARQKAGLPVSQDTAFPMAVLPQEPCPMTGLWWARNDAANATYRFTKGDRMLVPFKGDIWYRLLE